MRIKILFLGLLMFCIKLRGQANSPILPLTGSSGANEKFQLPIWDQSFCAVNVEVKDVSNRRFNRTAHLSVNPIDSEANSGFYAVDVHNLILPDIFILTR